MVEVLIAVASAAALLAAVWIGLRVAGRLRTHFGHRRDSSLQQTPRSEPQIQQPVPTATNRSVPDRTAECQDCGERNPTGSTFCHHCSAYLGWEDGDAEQSSTSAPRDSDDDGRLDASNDRSVPDRVAECQDCKKLTPTGSAFCLYCGAYRGWESGDVEQSSTSAPRDSDSDVDRLQIQLPATVAQAAEPIGSVEIDPSTVSLDAAVRKALGIEVRLGALGIDVPPLRQGRSDIVRVVISRGQKADGIIAALVADSQVPAIEVINTSAVMVVDLMGRSFRVERLNPPEGEQIVSDTATWDFDVLPLIAGKQSLTVSASMRVPVPGHGERAVSVPSLTREFTIQIDRLYAGRTFVQRNWQWVGTSVLAAAAVVAGIIWR
ncbi:zinc ribbon domain-containing protein [Kribbella sp. VKM Ac-2568]|uniref:double zinc ribbon domain-containing protein n=1 Tax=Kribbella sp. VKM Ac-2568 TaxID=2512219 RepID=UPI0010EDF4C6|nr:zinc ribbon domain-containing protein [Kribbella sp. VKM Ac-2568]TCM46886.1 double zinc ribbon protein [Kribbella sp. VKM Ac-2568]